MRRHQAHLHVRMSVEFHKLAPFISWTLFQLRDNIPLLLIEAIISPRFDVPSCVVLLFANSGDSFHERLRGQFVQRSFFLGLRTPNSLSVSKPNCLLTL